MKKYNVDRNRLVIELTESGFIESDRFGRVE
jgi:EAL domain-containing protein (putative c-di-GMP-specific phosphodiesterase class I)